MRRWRCLGIMGEWPMRKSLPLALLTSIALVGLVHLALKTTTTPVDQASLASPRIYAYRDWQSLGVRLRYGDEVQIRAQGKWSYTPDEYHGPEGHARFLAPGFYPLPGVPGGALIGRIGEAGECFYVGKRTSWYVDRPGTLYLRIDDDRLGDNDGYVTVEVTVISAEALD
jgi:hypothetical protein